MRPWVIIHNGVSLDGRLDVAQDDKAGLEVMSTYYATAHTLSCEAMICGSSTMLEADMPEVEDADAGKKSLHPQAVKYLVVVDSGGRVRNWSTIVRQPYWEKCIVLCSRGTDAGYLKMLTSLGIPFIHEGEEKVDFPRAFEVLQRDFGIRRLRVDSGGVLNGVLVGAGLADEISLLVFPILVGGGSTKSFFEAPDGARTGEAVRLRLKKTDALPGGIVWLIYGVDKAS